MVFPDDEFSAATKSAQSLPKTHIVPAAHGFAFEVRKGEHFRVVDLYGEQIVGMSGAPCFQSIP
jgi:uncharacterized protein